MSARLRHWLLFAVLVSLLSACGTASTEAPAAVTPLVNTAMSQPATPATPAADPATDAATDTGVDAASTPATAPADPVLVPTATPVPPANPADLAFTLETVASGLDQPLFVTHAGDGSGRLFVVEKPGVIRILADGVLVDTPFLDIRDAVNDGGSEQGLLGLAFAPDYATSGLFYVNYTDGSGDTTIARFRVSADPNQADPAGAETILTVGQPARNHNGGMLAFGPDGMLYIGMGDGGGANDTFGNGQNPASLLGKLLRIDVSNPDVPYTIPADNPWVNEDWIDAAGNSVDVRDEILAVGLRNPWRFSFDRTADNLWIGDVGQNQYEEVDVVPASQRTGLNFGWPIMEGVHCFRGDGCNQDGLILPVAEYSHQGGHCSVTGGYVYRGTAFPAMQGIYVYGDYCSGVIWALAPDAAGAWQSTQILDTSFFISSFGEDEQGELYVTDLTGGTVARIGVAE